MHDPICFLAMGCTASVENQRFSHADALEAAVHCLVAACGLPKPSCSGPVGPCSRGVFLILVAKEVPLSLLARIYPAPLCSTCKTTQPSISLIITPHILLSRQSSISMPNVHSIQGLTSCVDQLINLRENFIFQQLMIIQTITSHSRPRFNIMC